MKTLLAWLPTSSLLVKGCKFTPLFCSYDLQAGRDLLWHGASVILPPSSIVSPRCLFLFDKPGVLGVLRTYCNPDFYGPSHYKMYCILCLFVWFTYLSRIFHTKVDVTITGERLQILTYSRHSLPLSSERSLACHTYCDTRHLFIMVVSEDARSHLLPIAWQWSCHYLF